MAEISIEVGPTLAGERIDRALALLGNLERQYAAALVEEGWVFVDERVERRKSRRLRLGERLRANWPDPTGPPEPLEPPLVRYEDEDLVVLAKPAGLIAHRTHVRDRRPSVADWALARYPEIAALGGDPLRRGLVHRLDVGTSGLMVIARSPRALGELAHMVAAHEVERHYLALVAGEAPERARIEAPIGRDLTDPARMTIAQGGRPASTVLERHWAGPDTSLCELRLETGRTHQIRVHLAAIGHGVVGDARYGVPLAGLDRPFLHAALLRLRRPRSGEPIEVEEPLPQDLHDLARRARTEPILG